MKGFGGMPGNLQGLMKQAQKMQQDLQRVQDEADKITGEGNAGGGMVKIVANGKNQIVSVVLDKKVVNPEDVEILQDLILAAANDALSKIQETLKKEMAKVTGGLPIPGM